MIQILHSPSYSQQYIPDYDPEETLTFNYNVVGANNNVTYTFRSLQAKLDTIGRDSSTGNAIVTLRENITDYLLQVKQITGNNPVIYIDDKIVAYTGVYYALNAATVGSVTRFVIANIGNAASTYLGDVDFPDDYTSQIVYKYRNIFQFEVYDVSYVGTTQLHTLITTVRQQSNRNGEVVFNVSEIVKGYVPENGALSVSVKATETDYFGNTDNIDTDDLHLIDAGISTINYGEYILFNPNTAGTLLDTTGYRLIYNPSKIYPFYINFICNETVIQRAIRSVEAYVNIYSSNMTVVNTVSVPISINIGLNVIDISGNQDLLFALNRYKPTKVGISIIFNYEITGEFDRTQFNPDEFDTPPAGEMPTLKSHEYLCDCINYTLNNRRDFLFIYDNGIGGKSSYLCNQFKQYTEPEIVALRNQDNISNRVARETELVDLIFKYEDLNALRFLFGYDVSLISKESGIYESRNIVRIGELGDTKTWIIQSNTYDVTNEDLYKDFTLTLYRPLFSGFDTPVPSSVMCSVSDITPASAKVSCTVTQIGGTIIERGIYMNGVKKSSFSTSNSYVIEVTDLISGTTYTIVPYVVAGTQEYRGNSKTFIAQ